MQYMTWSKVHIKFKPKTLLNQNNVNKSLYKLTWLLTLVYFIYSISIKLNNNTVIAV